LIPEIDLDYYELELLSDGKKDPNPIVLSFSDLRKMKSIDVTATIACAGNKRKSLAAEYPNIKGLKWTIGAVGNSVYRGVPIRDVLLDVMGKKEEDLIGKGLHLITIAYDADFQGKHYEVSIPIEEALDPRNEVILAYEMNGQLIPKVHGFPVRMVVPGYIGVRSAKWVHKIIISTEEADSAPQRRDYKIVKDKSMDTV
jgi:DMSO/TMAO reductase YedYZ molybdopterin-dependent catalytic subunit